MQKRLRRIAAGIAAAVLFIPSCCVFAAGGTDNAEKASSSAAESDTQDEKSDYVMRTENEVLKTMTKACENSNFVLYYSENEDLLALENRRNGYVWWSSPFNAEGDPEAKGTIKKDLESSLTVVYGDPDARTGSTLRSAKNGKMKYRVSGNTLEVTYRFPSAGFVIPVRYTLEEDFLSASADTSAFEESKKDGDEKTILLEMSVLPNMLTAGSIENGYYIVPDGSGAVINFNNGKTSARAYSSRVYGNDITAVPLYRPDRALNVSLPLYASVKDTGNGMLAVVHEGDSGVLIQSSVSGLSKSSYNTCSSRFILRNTDTYYMNSEPLTVFENSDISMKSLEIRFYPLYEKGLDYADVAGAYRRYLTDVCGVEKKEDTLPLCVDLYGGVRKKEPFLGIPVTRKKPVTTFKQAEEIVRSLYDSGADSMVVTLENWTSDGINGKVDFSAKPSSVLGTASDFRSMTEFFSENDIRFYPVVNNTVFSAGNGYWSFSDTAMRTSGQYSKQVSYSAAYGTRDGTKKPVSLLSPAVYPELFAKISSSWQKAGLDGICPGDLTTVLYGDYGKKHTGRSRAEEYITDGLALFRQNIGSVMADGASAYAFPYADYISDVPLVSSGYDIFDEDIPFVQIALHGLVPYSSTSVNGDADPERLVLMAAAAGSGIHFDMVYEETSGLKDTEYDIYYYADSSYWLKTAAAEYRFIKDVLSDLKDEYIVSYTADGDIIETVYSSGTSVKVDLAAQTAEKNGKTYALQDYLRSDGGIGN